MLTTKITRIRRCFTLRMESEVLKPTLICEKMKILHQMLERNCEIATFELIEEYLFKILPDDL